MLSAECDKPMSPRQPGAPGVLVICSDIVRAQLSRAALACAALAGQEGRAGARRRWRT